MAPATLFFDLDKTLCHPRVAFIQIFTASCAPLLDAATEAQSLSLLNAWAEALEEPGPSATAACLTRALAASEISAQEHLIERCARALIVNWAETQELDSGVSDMLAHLARLHPLGLITNGPSDAQRAVITALGLNSIFRWRIVSGDETVGIRKPNREIFQMALAMSGSLPENTWYIGDSPINDIAGAAGVGWRTCWISPPDEHFTEGLPAPDARISRLDELPQAISRFR